MLLAIILTFVITVLSMFVLVLRYALKESINDKKALRADNDILRRRMDDYYDRERCRREKNAYNKGIYDGRKTDTLYRSILNKYKSGEHITIMCDGESGEDYE